MTYFASASRMEEFIAGPVWADMRAELDLWRQACESEYGACQDLRTLGHIQGRVEALEYVKGMPHALLEFIREKAKEEQKRGANVEDPDDELNLEPDSE